MKNYTKQEILKIILSVAKEYDEKLNDKHFKITYQKGARRIYTYTEDYNLSCQHLCEKLGMRREGMFMEFVSFIKNSEGNPIYENTIQYAILKKEWKK